MRCALAVNRVSSDIEANLADITVLTHQAAESGADLVLFPEAAVTGLINNDDPAHDLPLGRPIPGPITERLTRLAAEGRIYLGIGVLERDGYRLYDSAVLFAPNGEMALHYRRIQPQWHGRKADPAVYRQGDEVVATRTPFGLVTFLICGDLFDDDVVARTRALSPDYLLFSFARSFSDGSLDQKRWGSDEEAEYAARASAVGCTALMVNGLEDPAVFEYPSFGGAMVVSASGEILARWPLGKPGILHREV